MDLIVIFFSELFFLMIIVYGFNLVALILFSIVKLMEVLFADIVNRKKKIIRIILKRNNPPSVTELGEVDF